MKRYKIFVHQVSSRPLIFHTSNYEINNGVIRFLDEKIGRYKVYDMRNCEIEEEVQ